MTREGEGPVDDVAVDAPVDVDADVDAGAPVDLDSPVTRRQDVQGLRGIAVLLVVVFHAGLAVPGGFTGVDIFFVISGFVITALLVREAEGSGTMRLRDFYTRRARRLFPALALTVTVTALLGLVLLSPLGPQGFTMRTGISASTFSANIYLFRTSSGYFDVAPTENALLHTWSLSVEEQFYLVFPLLLLVAWRATRRRSAAFREAVGFVVLAFVALVSFAIAVVTTAGRGERLDAIAATPQQFAFYGSPARAWEFLAGALVALLARRLARIPAGVAQGLAAAGLVLLAWSALRVDGVHDFPGPLAALPVAGAALVIVAGLATARGIPGLLAWRPLTRLGDLSYGWYLWHWPFIVFARTFSDAGWVAPLAGLLALGVAVLSSRWLENPIRFDHRIRGRRVVALAVGCIVVPVLVGVGALAIGPRTRSADLVRAYRPHADFSSGCDSPLPLGDRSLASCTWTVPKAKGTVVLVGDSNAGHFAEPATTASRDAGYDLVLAIHAGCPFADVASRVDGADPLHCRDFVRGTVDELVATRPALVVIASASARYVEEDRYDLRTASGRWTHDPVQKAAAWERGTRAVLRRLGGAGIPVAIVHPVPQHKGWSLLDCSPFRHRFLRSTCSSTLRRADAARDRRLAVDAEAAAVRASPGAVAIDPFPELCDARGCPTERRGTWLYRDDIHLSIDGANRLTPLFAGAIRELAGAAPA